MKHIMILAASVLALGAASPAFAGEDGMSDGTGDGFFVGAGAVMYDNNDVIGIQGTAGYNFAKYFGVEGVVSTSVVNEDLENTNITVGVDVSAAAFAVARMASDDYAIYAKLGYHSTDFGVDVGTASTSINLSGVAAGIGMDWYFNEHSGVRLEAVSYDTKDLNVQGVNGMTLISLSYLHKF